MRLQGRGVKERAAKRPAKKPAERVPFPFVFEYLYPLEPVTKPMFGCHALYIGRKICLILRKRASNPSINGVWIATSREHHESLKKELPSMKSVTVLGKAPTNWQVIRESGASFEEEVIRACELVKRGDARIGRIPNRKKGTQ
jgi:hypothetical protein